jgi:hypothetical protein
MVGAMTELILSDITRMGRGYCVIGLQPQGLGYRSVRPLPPASFSWPVSFAYHRGDRLQFNLVPADQVRPHVEDQQSAGVLAQVGRISEEELLACLRRAEVAARVSQLFGCPVTPGKTGASIHAPKARRSICGAEAARIRLKWEASQLRAHVALASGDVLPDLPVVDRSWHTFLETVAQRMSGANRGQRLNRVLEARLQSVSSFFVRLGLTRPKPPRWGRCQVMLDTLFPLPRKSWVDETLVAVEPQ